MEANWIQQIEAYLRNELSAVDRLSFEAHLATDEKLRAELELQRLTYDGLKRMGQRKFVQQTGKIYRFRKQLRRAIVCAAVLSTLLAAGYMISNTYSSGQETEPIELNQEQIEKMEQNLAFDNIIPEYFQFNGKDGIFLSESGVLLSVKSGAFQLNGQPYDGTAIIQWQEAQNASDIVKSGLSTVSGNKLLETQGMFSLQAFTPDGKQLALADDKAVYVQVPVQELKEGMMLFTGVPDKKGNVDWQNPVPLEKLPVQADMKDLNFYPPGYENKLAELSWEKNKKQKDSLYLSFEEQEQGQGMPKGSNARQKADSISYSSNTGEMLFKQKCATCHDAHKEGTGPPLFKVREKWTKGQAHEGALYVWVWDWPLAAASDPFAAEVKNMRPTAMSTFPELKGKYLEVEAIFDYIDGIPKDKHIPPSKVLAMWKQAFNNTNLATRDFEKRMQAIHGTCSEKVFNVYMQVHKPIWKLDQQVAQMGYPEFNEFALERVGKVNISDEHQRNLKKFYEQSVAQFKLKAKSDKDFQRKLDAAWDNKINAQRRNESERTNRRISQSLNEEYAFNLKNVYKQLGKTQGFYLPASRSVRPTTVNIDRLVLEATIARTSTIITDPDTGKTAKITYNECSATVSKAKNFDKLFMYVLPYEINSFERIDARNGKFSYNLNGDMNYQLAFIGINESGYFYAERKNLSGGDLGEISLESISEEEFSRKITQLNKLRGTGSMGVSQELSWLRTEQNDIGVQRKRVQSAIFRSELLKVVYPCMKEISGEEIPEPTEIVVDDLFK